MGLKGFFEKKRLMVEQKQTERLNKQRLRLKAKRSREEVRASHRRSIASDKKKLAGFKKNKIMDGFGGKLKKKLAENKKKNAGMFATSSSSRNIYTQSSGTNPYDFSGTSSKKKNKKRSRGKTITIRL